MKILLNLLGMISNARKLMKDDYLRDDYMRDDELFLIESMYTCTNIIIVWLSDLVSIKQL